MEKLTMAGGIAVRYFDRGKGEKVILLLHGYLESIDVWEEFAGHLASEFRVVGFDIPGHGISEVAGEVHTMEMMADVAADLLRRCEIEKCVAVGHSMGGYVALALAEKYPRMLAGLVLLHSTPDGETEEKRKNRQREIELVRANKKELLARIDPEKIFAPDNRKKFRQVIDQLGETVMLTEDEGIIALLNGMMTRKDTNETLRKLAVPQLLIFGNKDEIIPEEAARLIIRSQPQAEVLWLENSGHMGFVEEEKRVADSVEEFARRCFEKE